MGLGFACVLGHFRGLPARFTGLIMLLAMLQERFSDYGYDFGHFLLLLPAHLDVLENGYLFLLPPPSKLDTRRAWQTPRL